MTDATIETPEVKTVKTFSEEDVARLMKDRVDRERANSQGEIDKLKKQLEDLSAKAQKGTATTDEMTQLQTANKAAEQAQAQGYTQDDMHRFVDNAMQQKDLESKLIEAKQKDPEFAKLVEENGKTNRVKIEHVVGAAYLPNAVAVIKHLMKDKKSMDLYDAAIANASRDGGVAAMMVLNNFSDRLTDKKETPHASEFTPAEELPDASDDDQSFNETSYIGNNF